MAQSSAGDQHGAADESPDQILISAPGSGGGKRTSPLSVLPTDEGGRTPPVRPPTRQESPHDWPPGVKLGDFILEELLVGGGMGVVFRAKNTVSKVQQAIKTIRNPTGSKDEEEEFLREVETLAGLKHPNIVEVLTAGVDGEHLFFAMPLEPTDLHRRLVDAAQPAKLVAQWVRQVASAIAFAHERPIPVLHRDLKPANVLLTATDDAKVADFGLLAFASNLRGADHERRGPLGTPNYMPPEQAEGKMADIRSDIYGIGAILYECLTRKPPYMGNDKDAVLRRVRDPNEIPVSPRFMDPRVPRRLSRICMKCLEMDPAARYQSAREVERELAEYLRPPLWKRVPMAIPLGAFLLLTFGTMMAGREYKIRADHAALGDVFLSHAREARDAGRSGDSEANYEEALKHFDVGVQRGLGSRDLAFRTAAARADFADHLIKQKSWSRATSQLHAAENGEADAWDVTGDEVLLLRARLCHLRAKIAASHDKDYRKAESLHQEEILLRDSVSAATDADAKFRKEKALAHGFLGDVQVELKMRSAAETSYGKAFKYREELVSDHRTEEFVFLHARDFSNMAAFYERSDDAADLELALEWRMKARQYFQDNADLLSPNDLLPGDYLTERADWTIAAAAILIRKGKLPESESLLKDADVEFKRIQERDPNRPAVLVGDAERSLNWARHHIGCGNSEEGRSQLLKADGFLKLLADQGRCEAENYYTRAVVRSLLADLSTGDQEKVDHLGRAREYFDAADQKKFDKDHLIRRDWNDLKALRGWPVGNFAATHQSIYKRRLEIHTVRASP